MADFTPLTGKVKRRNFLTVDVESKDGDSQRAGFTRPFMVGVYDGEKYVAFFNQDNDGPWEENYWKPGGCVDKAMRYICQKKYRGWNIFAHNGGRFDYLHFLSWLMDEGERRGFKFTIVPVASSIQVLDVWRGEKWNKFRFVDSVKLIPLKLDDAAKSFGLEGKLQHDLHMHETDPRWRLYNEQDCIQLYRVMEKFHHYIEVVLGGEVGMTAPSTAVKLLRRRYMKAAVPRSEETHEFVRRSYVGGRVEVFRSFGEGLSYFDINSSYPAAMLENMPAGPASMWDGEPPKRFKDRKIGFCDVSIHVPTTLHIPPLPLRGDKENGLPRGKLVFPTGNLRGIWEWEELKLALSVGCKIHEWHKSVWYEGVPLFREFVTDLYKYRNKDAAEYDEGLAAVAKNMMNSAYGKFGMKTLRKKIYRYDDPDLPACAKPVAGPDSAIWYAEEEMDAPYIMPQVSARVTALGRIALYKYMLSIQDSGGDIYYVDTDSLTTDTQNVETSNELGGLKDEYPKQSGRLHGRFLAPKLYMLTDDVTNFEKVKAKGLSIKKKDEEDPDSLSPRETFEKFASGKSIMLKRLEKVGTLARENFTRGPRVIEVPRTYKQDTLQKRIHHEDGTTSPYQTFMW